MRRSLLYGLMAWFWMMPVQAQEGLDAALWVEAQQVSAPLTPTHPNRFNYGHPWMLVGVRTQSLILYDEYGREQKRYVVSTAKNGVGEVMNSYQTPRGWHRVCARIGDGAPLRTIISRREVTEWQYTPELHAEFPKKDWILTRIMWLCGMEEGLNKGGNVDSYDRYIYIHGAGDHAPFGTPSSLGCVRMKNEDVLELFDETTWGIDVFIDENA